MDAGIRSGRRHASQDFRGAAVKADARTLTQRRHAVEQVQPDVDPPCRLEGIWLGQRVPANDVRHLDTANVDRDTLAGFDRPLGPSVHL